MTQRGSLVAAALTALLYLPRLGSVPVYLAPDEVFIALHADSLATSARDYGGRRLPLYIEYRYFVIEHGQRVDRSGWLPPVIYYTMAAVLRVLPLSEFSVRLPTVIVGAIDVALMYLIGLRLFKRRTMAVLAAALLALTPAHVIHSRLGMDYLYPLPFLLTWLLMLTRYLEDNEPRGVAVATAALGFGLYSYIGAALAMPLYLLLTLVILWFHRAAGRVYAWAAAGFLIAAAPHVPWLLAHPGALSDILAKYGFGSSSGQSAPATVRSLLRLHFIGDQLSRLWAFFDPRFLFFDGAMEPMYSTRRAGVFLLPLAPLAAAGVVALVQRPVGAHAILLLAGAAIAPLPATLVNVPDAIYRALELLPFVVLIAVYGMAFLWDAADSRWRGALRAAAVACALTAVVQFAFFYADYLTQYPRRSSLVFSGNIRGALEEAMRAADAVDAPAIYLGRIGPYGKGGIYWKFYVAKYGRRDLDARAIDAGVFEPDAILKLKHRTIIVTNAGEGAVDTVVNKLVAAGDLTRRAVVSEPDGTPSFLILERM